MKTTTFVALALLASCGSSARPDPTVDGAEPDEGYTCQHAVSDHGYVGCDYWPVDLDNAFEIVGAVGLGCPQYGAIAKEQTREVCWDSNASAPHGLCDPGGVCPNGYSCEAQRVCVLDAQDSPFAIVVSNPDPLVAVTAMLTNSAGKTASVEIDPGTVEAILPQDLGFPDASLDGTAIEAKAYHLVTNRPIVAYQFNPLDHVDVFSNDASLLIPSHTYGTDYLAMTYRTAERRPSAHDFHGYITVVGSGAGPITVTVTPTADVMAGGTVPAIPAGTTQTFTLRRFETLNLEAAGTFDPAGGDLTGSAITCSEPCGVFVGHEATTVAPASAPRCCADHLEEQLYPAAAWGKTYALAVSAMRPMLMPDMFRIMAQRPNTVLTFSPPQAGCPPMLGRGEHCDVTFGGDLQVTATEPILVGHYLESTGGTGPNSGDPAMSFPAPTEQFRTDYALLVPQHYNSNYLSIVTATAGQVFVDGVEMVGLTPVGGSAFKAARIPVKAGYHHVTCPSRCGVEVYGWANAVSYLFAGGLDLAPIID